MKIAEIVCTFPPYAGGIGNVAYNNARELARRGHDVTVFTPRQNQREKPDKVKNEENNFKIKWLRPIFRYGNAAFLPQLLWQLRSFDIIHLHYPFFGAAEIVRLSLVISHRSSVKLVITYHMDVVSDGLLGRFFCWHTKYIMPRIMRAADKVIVTSFDYAENSNLAPLIKENREKFVEIPCGVAIDKFFPREKDPALLARHGLNNNDRIILFVGNLDRAHYFKGVDYLFRAFAIMQQRLGVEKIKESSYAPLGGATEDKKKQGEKIRLLVVGSGDLFMGYEGMAKTMGLADKIIFAGFVSDEELPRYYNLADIFVLPSVDKSEAFGMVAIEAMASGKPVVASNLAGVRSVVRDGETGYLIQPQNEGDLANRLSHLLADTELMKKMGEAGRRIVEERYSWEGIGNKLEALFLDVAGLSNAVKREKRKICLINNIYKINSRSGAEVVAENIVEGLENLGHEVFVITAKPFEGLGSLRVQIPLNPPLSRGQEEIFPSEGSQGYVYRFFPLNIFSIINIGKHNAAVRFIWHIFDVFNLHSYFVARKILEIEKPDVIMTHNLKGLGYLIPRAIKKSGIKWAHTIHDVQLSTPSGLIIKGEEGARGVKGIMESGYKKICRWLFDSPDVVISPSKWLMDFYGTRGFFSGSKKVVLPNPIKFSIFPSSEAELLRRTGNSQFSIKSQIPNSKLQFLYLGQIEEHKGVLFLVEVFKKFCSMFHVPCALVIAGDGSKLDEIKKIAADEPRIKVMGRVPHEKIAELFQKAAFTIVPSLCYENSPTVIYESLSFGVPVVAAKIGGVAELVKDGVNGLTFEAGSEDDLLRVLKLAVGKFSFAPSFAEASQGRKASENREEIQKTVEGFGVEGYIAKLLNS